MPKSLQEMSLEELWQLFPVELVGHRPEWSLWAEDEIRRLSQHLSAFSPVITHIGSTAIPDIMAKPTVDLLVEVPSSADFASVAAAIESAGYLCMLRTPSRISFNKGYTPQGYASRVFHLHLRRTGDNDEIFFRDYLRTHPQTARAYERLKLSLLPRFRHNRDAYTAAKTDFVQSVLTKRNKNLNI